MVFLTMSPTRARPSPIRDDDARWEAVTRRDRSCYGAFYYSVRTTGVYCRPSCAARMPRRENVQFHDSCAAAERAGFRPCKRCRPNDVAPDARQAAAVAKACRMIEEADEGLSLAVLAKAAGMSRFHFHRLFKATTGVTPKAYADARRGRRARDALAGRGSVTATKAQAGITRPMIRATDPDPTVHSKCGSDQLPTPQLPTPKELPTPNCQGERIGGAR